MSFQTCLSLFLLWNTTEDIWENVNVCFVHTMQVNGNQNYLVTNILQNIFFCVPQKKESEVWNDMRVMETPNPKYKQPLNNS